MLPNSRLHRSLPKARKRDPQLFSLCSANLSCVQASKLEGPTCEQLQAALAEQECAFLAWKEENDVRDCPSCKSQVEMVDGCSHMACTACDSHFCWACQAVFDEATDAYEHLRVVYPGIYDEGWNDGWEDPAEFDKGDDDAETIEDEDELLDEAAFQVQIFVHGSGRLPGG